MQSSNASLELDGKRFQVLVEPDGPTAFKVEFEVPPGMRIGASGAGGESSTALPGGTRSFAGRGVTHREALESLVLQLDAAMESVSVRA